MSAEIPKATLYTFDGSVWASAPRLALIEKGYSSSDVDIKVVDLVKGENFDPSYLRINSKGTVPTLVVPLLETTSAEVDTKFRAINDTKAILEFLDKSRSQNTLGDEVDAKPAPILAPATIEGKSDSDEIIKLVHESSVDPNFLLLGARSEAELQTSKKALPGTFVTNRYNALLENKNALDKARTTAFDGSANPKASAIHENLKKWYEDKLESQSLLTNAYVNNDAQAIQQLIQLTNATWKNVAETLATLDTKLQGPLALGDQISLADLHVIPWLARICAIAGGLAKDDDPLKSLDAVVGECGGKVGEKVRGLWTVFQDRPSFKVVYADGLH
ncbi:uncharacterized protein MEPE_06385 [Melanopsichium pennsylvanicum]|uniref:GST N-terminal domain-containing protein n=2 Tax=Melanopsichium pennsylvanicum TaxID=63383 RepID=A0AAJ5C863_9BASI|nr:glutathione s-transferase [Melanopsichium pennsylvanicum 4]SNX87675.1 uncharacterized protein MEPE_06385 [Melanopsichium pennsylvanicum]